MVSEELRALLGAPAGERGAADAMERRLTELRARDPAALAAGIEEAVAAGGAPAEARLFLARHLTRARDFAGAGQHLRALHATTGRPALLHAWLRRVVLDPAAFAAGIEGGAADAAADSLGGLAAAGMRAQLAVARAALSGGPPAEAPLAAFRAALAAWRAAAERQAPVAAASPAVAENAAVEARAIALLRGASSIALVGSGPSLAAMRLGAAIDAHGGVLRINLQKLEGRAAEAGARTDLVAFGEARIFPRERARLRAALEARPGVPHILTSGGLAETPALPRPALAALQGVTDRVALLTPRWRRPLKALCYEVPTTGTATLVWVLLLLGLPCTAFGLDLYRGGDHRHFYDTGREPWLGHETDYERWFVHVFLRAAVPELRFGTPGGY